MEKDLDGLRQCSASVGHGSSVHGGAVWRRWCKSSDGPRGNSDGLEKPGATVVLQPECMARRRAREALAASAQNRHPSYQDIGECVNNRQDRRLGQDPAQEARRIKFLGF